MSAFNTQRFMLGLVSTFFMAETVVAQNVELVGSFGDSIRAVAVQGNLAYAVTGAALQIVDVSNPAAPALLGTIDTGPGASTEVAVVGDTAYVIANNGFFWRLQMIDVTNPALPVLGTSFSPPASYYAVALAVEDSFVYVADKSFGLQIVDVSQRNAPSSRGRFPSEAGYDTTDLSVSGSHAFLCSHTLKVLDITDPDHPVLLGEAYPPFAADGPQSAFEVNSVGAEGNLIFLAGTVRGVFHSIPPYSYYDSDAFFDVVNVSDPTRPASVGSYRIGGYEYTTGEVVAVSGPLAYFAFTGNGSQIYVLDVSNPGTPPLLGQYPILPTNLAAGGELVFATSASGTLSILRYVAPTPTPTPAPTPITMPIGQSLTLNYTESGGDAHNWLGGAVPGFGGTTEVTTSGLCMSVPAAGDNFTLWVSPERYLELHDDMIYRVRVNLSTDQTATDAIPLFFVGYDNFISAGGGNNFGGFYWVLDVDGGAEGIGRPQGRASYDFYIAPNAINTHQWKLQAFTPAADAENDVRLQYRVIDANPALLTDNDSGTICISSVQITALSRSGLALDQTVYDPPIASSTHFATANNDVGAGGVSEIDDVNHWARYQIPTTGDNRRTLGPYDPAAGVDLNSQLYPVIWDANRLYRVRARIRAESSEADPVDAIYLAMDTATEELGMSLFGNRGAPGGPMDRAASPKLAPAEYEGYFFSQNATASLTPNAGRLRPLAIFFNTTAQGGDGTGGDAFIVESLAVDKLVTPP